MQNRKNNIICSLNAILNECSNQNSSSTLTLTANYLQVLNEGFKQFSNRSGSEGNSIDGTSIETQSCSSSSIDLQLCESFKCFQKSAQKFQVLKLIQTNETLQGIVDCKDLPNITTLELKCLPLYQLCGLSCLSSHLKYITCTGCAVGSIQELFEFCGADKSSDADWPELVEVHLPYNNLQSLDSSLVLTPKLSYLDLSHNSIQRTKLFLTVLDNLETLDLSYNQLDSFPSLATSALCHLSKLNLRNNLLKSLLGVERLVCLTHLDVSNNLLSSITQLCSFKTLTRLKFLYLTGNPLCYHPRYRESVILRLHPAAVVQISLDNQVLTKKERSKFRDTLDTRENPLANAIAADLLMLSESSNFTMNSSLTSSNERTPGKRCPRRIIRDIPDQEELDSGSASLLESSEFFAHSYETFRTPEGQYFVPNRVRSTPSTSRRKRKKSRKRNGDSEKIKNDDEDSISNIEVTGNRLRVVADVRSKEVKREFLPNNASLPYFKPRTSLDDATIPGVMSLQQFDVSPLVGIKSDIRQPGIKSDVTATGLKSDVMTIGLNSDVTTTGLRSGVTPTYSPHPGQNTVDDDDDSGKTKKKKVPTATLR